MIYQHHRIQTWNAKNFHIEVFLHSIQAAGGKKSKKFRNFAMYLKIKLKIRFSFFVILSFMQDLSLILLR